MKFFRLTHPSYVTDREFALRNPAKSTANHHIPGILCSICGPWASSNRLRISLLPHQANEFTDVKFLPVADWMNAKINWAEMLGIDPDLIKPGATLGPPSGVCTSAITEDVVHPTPGEIWVATHVRDALTEAKLTGASFASVQLHPRCGKQSLSEIVVHGRALRQGSTKEALRLCDICGRQGFPTPQNLAIDENHWDGLDFLIVDENPNIIITSERVAAVFNANSFSNIVTSPI